MTLTLDLSRPRYICNLILSKLGQIFTKILYSFGIILRPLLRYGVHKVFGMHRLTHSLTDGQTQIQYASGTIFQLILTGVYPYMPTPLGCIPPDGLQDVHYQNFLLFWPWGLTPGPKFTKIGDDLLRTQVYHPAKFHRPASTHAGDICYTKFAERQTKKQTNKQ